MTPTVPMLLRNTVSKVRYSSLRKVINHSSRTGCRFIVALNRPLVLPG